MVGVREVGLKVFGEVLDTAQRFLVTREKPEHRHAIPSGNVVNVFVVIEAMSPLVIRHNEPEELVTMFVGSAPAPAILNTKLQGVARRTLLYNILTPLYNSYEEVRKAVEEATGKTSWQCYVRPHVREGTRPEQGEEAVEAYCGSCPACLLFGYTMTERGAGPRYNVKSHVEGDVYVATVPVAKASMKITRNAVHDVTKTTEQALFTVNAVKPGTLFVGKVAVKDVTLAELLLLLAAYSRVTRIGAVQTHFGEIKIRIPAVVFANRELGFGYDLARQIHAGGGLTDLEAVIDAVQGYARNITRPGEVLYIGDVSASVTALTEEELAAVAAQAWRDAAVLKASLELFVSSGGKKKQ